LLKRKLDKKYSQVDSGIILTHHPLYASITPFFTKRIQVYKEVGSRLGFVQRS
jgi:hypothetical protein